jgi:20S proteasome alpha/beta subunit
LKVDGRIGLLADAFSQGGKLGQLEHAMKVFPWSVCRCEVQVGAVVGCESKSNSPLAERRTNLKVQEITPKVGCVYSGLDTD